jgi:hypothetical protein
MSYLANITDFWLRMPKTNRSLFRLFLPTSKERNSRKCHLVFHFSRSNCGASERNVLATGEKGPNIFRPLSEIGSPDPGNCNRKKSRPNHLYPENRRYGEPRRGKFSLKPPGKSLPSRKFCGKYARGNLSAPKSNWFPHRNPSIFLPKNCVNSTARHPEV